MRGATAASVTALALMGAGCADLFGLDPVVRGDATNTSTATTTSSTAGGGDGGTDPGTSSGGGGSGDGGSAASAGGGGAGGADCDPVDVASEIAHGELDEDLDGWEEADLGLVGCEGACTLTVTGGDPSLSRDITVSLEQSTCLRFTAALRSDDDVVAVPRLRGTNVTLEAPGLEVEAGTTEPRTGICRVPLGFEAAEAGFVFRGPAAPLLDGTAIDVHTLQVDVLEGCPDEAPRCTSPDYTLWWDEPIQDSPIAATDFTAGGTDQWNPQQGTWSCGPAGCTIAFAGTASLIGRDVAGFSFPAGSCLVMEVDAVAEDPSGEVFVGIGTSAGVSMNTPYVAIAEDAAMTCRIPHDVTIGGIATSFVVEPGTEVTVREVRVSRATSCPCAPSCEPTFASPCPQSSGCIDAEGVPVGAVVSPPTAIEGEVAGFGSRGAVRLDLDEDTGVSLLDDSFSAPANRCVQPVVRARAASEDVDTVDVFVESYDLSATIAWELDGIDAEYRDHYGDACRIPAVFDVDAMGIAIGQASTGVLDVDRIELRPAMVNACRDDCPLTATSTDQCDPPPQPNLVAPFEDGTLGEDWVAFDVDADYIPAPSCDGDGYFRFLDGGNSARIVDTIGTPPTIDAGTCLDVSVWARVSGGTGAVRPVLTLFPQSERHELAPFGVVATQWTELSGSCAVDTAASPTSITLGLELDVPSGEALLLDALSMALVPCVGGEVVCTTPG